MVFLSIHVCSIRPANIVGMMDNLQATADDPDSFELLVSIDEGDDAMIRAIEEHRGKVGFRCSYVQVPKREGYFSLHHGYEALRAAMAPAAYFAWQISDEIRIATRGWDTKLKEYMHLFPDDLFRLRLSLNKWRNYYYLYQCFPMPDNYTVTARKWYEVTEGSGEIWGPDTWHQAIDFFLGQLNNPYAPEKGVFRSIPVHNIALENETAGKGIDSAASARRKKRIKQVYRQLCGLRAQEKFLRLAQLVNAHIWMSGYAREFPHARLTVREDKQERVIRVVRTDALDAAPIAELPYRILPFLCVQQWHRLRRMLPNLRPMEYASYCLSRRKQEAASRGESPEAGRKAA